MFGGLEVPRHEYELLNSMKPDGVVYFCNDNCDLKPQVCPILFVENCNSTMWNGHHKDLYKILFTMRWTLKHFSIQVEEACSVFGMLSNANRVQFLQLRSEVYEKSNEIAISYALDASRVYDLNKDYAMITYVLNEIAKHVRSNTTVY